MHNGTPDIILVVCMMSCQEYVNTVVVCLHTSGSKFGTSTNSKGFKVLPPYLRVIQVP